MNPNHRTTVLTTVAMLIILLAMMIGYMFFIRTQDSEIMAHGTPTIVPQTVSMAQPKIIHEFTDGLGNTINHQSGNLDEFGVGISGIDVYHYDINRDGLLDRISRTRHERGTAHFSDSYTIELNVNGAYYDITPTDLSTVRGADCALQLIQFSMSPVFQIIKISRPWIDAWHNPSMATRTVYQMRDNSLVVTESKDLQLICDVSELFFED